MITVILFQINILTLTLVAMCGSKKKNYDGDGDISLVQPSAQKASTPLLIGGGGGNFAPTSPASKPPMNDDFSVGVPPPHIPLADKSDERTLADIESIQSEKTVIRDKKNSKSTTASKLFSGSKSPEVQVGGAKLHEVGGALNKNKKSKSRSPDH